MKEFSPSLERSYSEKTFKHLEKGVKPIIVSMNSSYKYAHGEHGLETQNKISDLMIGGERIDDHASYFEREEHNIISADQHSFLISDCNPNNKFSEGYIRCVGLLMIGKDKEADKEISLLLHADPYFCLAESKEREYFMLGLHNQLSTMKEMCKEGTIDAIMFGGSKTQTNFYKDSINQISDEVKKNFSFSPTIVAGPNDSLYPANIYVDTQKRQAYFVRGDQEDNTNNQPTMPENIDEKYSDQKTNEENLERVSPSSWLVAYKRALTDIPYAHEFYVELKKIREQKGEIGLYKYLESSQSSITIEARYKLVDKLLEELAVKQVLELASGFSTRGLDKTKDKDTTYVEIDFLNVIDEKKQIIASLSNEFDIPNNENLFIEEGNVLDNSSFDRAVKHFDKNKPIVVISEGLLTYFNNENKTTLAKNIHSVLEKNGGAWITPDIRIKEEIFETADVQEGRQISQDTFGLDPEKNRFNNEEEAQKFFEDLGFKIEKHSFLEVLDQISVAENLGLYEEEKGEIAKEIEDRFAYILTLK